MTPDQVLHWKNNAYIPDEQIIKKITDYADIILKCTKENYPDDIFRFTRKITLINKLYEYLNNNPEFLCNMPLFLEQCQTNVYIFLNELVTMQKNITADLFLATYETLTNFFNIAHMIQIASKI
jgi:hypothetical protein